MSESPSGAKPAAGNILVAYFSWSGNTREIANQIHGLAGGGVFEIVSANPYPREYNATVEQARQEKAASHRPKLKFKLEKTKSFRTLFLGYPNWWSMFPMPVATFLEENDFSGKSIAPFCTHEGSRLGASVADIARLCPKSKILEAVAIRGSSVKNAKDEVARWISKLGL